MIFYTLGPLLSCCIKLALRVPSAFAIFFIAFLQISFSQTTVTYTATGTWTCPAGVTSATIECWGGGGAGGAGTGNPSAGGGGSGGAYVKNTAISVTAGTSYTVTVGSGGTGAATAAGGPGGSSWFNTSGTILAVGGGGGALASTNNSTAAGASAVTTGNIGGSTNYYGGAGGTGGASGASGGGGGGSGGTASAGNAAMGVTGGTAVAGGGAGANGSTTSGPGAVGSNPGGGGAGGRAGNNTDRAGGNGGNGQIKITYTCPTYSLTGTSGAATFQGSSSTVTLTSSAAGLPVGTYTVTYNLSAPNAATGLTASMTISTAGTGSFSTSVLANAGATTVTITNLTSGDPVAARCSNVISTNNTSVITVNAPPTYCNPAPTSVDGTGITNVTCGTINNTTGAEGTNYGNYSAQIASFGQGATVTVNITFSTGFTYDTKIWIDWNQNGDFLQAGEEVYSGTSTSANPTTLIATFVIPVGATLGNYRMRIGGVDSGPPTSCYTGTYGTFEDYTLNVIAGAAMVYSSCTATQLNTSTVAPGANTQEIIGIQIVTTGAVSPLSVTSFTVNANGTTAIADINSANSAKIYYTGTSSTFALTTYFGQNTPTIANFNITGSQVLSSGTNYFWLVYDIKAGATLGNVVDGECTSLNVGGARTPTVTAPAGSRPIALNYCASSATSSSDMDITKIVFGTINNTSATVSLTGTQGTATGTAGMYSDWRSSTVPVPSIQQGSTTAFSVIIGGTAYSHRVDVYFDFNLDGDMADAGESFAIFAYANPALPNTTNSSITIPITASTGYTLMRVVCVENSSTSDCGTYTWGETEDYLVQITAAPPCAGTPTAGTTTATPNSMCAGASSDLSLSGYTVASGITFQWQSSPNPITIWTDISGANSYNYTATPSASTNYRCVVTCTNSGLSANSTSSLVTITGIPTYATIPYSQSFEGPWINRCSTRDIPTNSWINLPVTGENSWRRNDDGLASGAWAGTSGSYSPTFTLDAYSARFHSYSSPNGNQGSLDLYVNLSPVGTKTLCFDYINTSGSDVLTVLLSTDGGSTFPTTLLTLTSNSGWSSQTVTISSTSATSVIRFRATSDYGTTDIGLDNIFLGLPPVPNCATYTAPANGSTNIVCGINALLSWTANGPTCFPPTSYDVYFGTSATPPYVANQAGTMYNPGTLATSTTYYWKILPRNSAGAASCATVWSFTTGTTFNVSQAAPPISDGFENCTDWTVVNGSQSNKWLRGTATASSGSYSMYINNTASNNNYDNAVTSTVHFYKDITFTAGNDNTLSFQWKGDAEGCCDELTVYLAPTSITPVAGTEMSSTYQIGAAYNQQTSWQTVSLTLPVGCNSETKRLIFSWHNDGSNGPNPPAAIDNISVVAAARTGTTCANPVNITLPYSKAGETTECMGDDYNNTSTPCASNNYVLGEDKVYKVLIGASGCASFSISNASSTSIGFQVYSGCPDAGGTCIAAAGGAVSGSLTADVNIPSAGYYYIVVDNWALPTPTFVTYDLAISAPGGNTSNDAVCSATALTLGIGGSGDNTCTNATGEPGVPACWTTGTMNTVWYRVTIPASKDIAVKTTAGSLLKTQIAIYSGNVCGTLTYVNCNQDAAACGSSSYYNSYILVEGINTTYGYIRVDGENDLTGTFSILVVDGNNGSPVWPSMPGQDCGPAPGSSNSLCSATTTVDNPGFLAYGNACDFPGGGSNCLLSGERSSVWYTIPINANGNLHFDIIPNDYPGSPSTAGSDYDFALWKLTGSGSTTCALIAGGAVPLKCNYSGLGVTGLSASGNAPASYPGFDGAYETEQAVLNGEVYILVISNYADDYVAGFTLNLLTSPVAYTPPGASVTWAGVSSTDWNLAGNWGGCSDPHCTLNAIINSGGAQPIMNSDGNVQDLTINAGATLTINAGVTLTVCGNLVNNGNLVMSSTATLLFNNGSVAQSISGNFTGANKIGNLTITKTGGSVTLNSAIDIGGNFTTSNATSIFNANNQTVKIAGNFSTAVNTTLTNCPNIEFNGTIPQTFSNSSGTISFTNVMLNNTGGGMTLTGGASGNLNITGVLTLTNGIAYTANPPLLIMAAGSSVSGGSSSSFVDGPMQKIGNTAFVFPVGDATNRWMRIGISAPTAASTFQAQYFYTAYSNYTSMCGTPTPVLNNASAFEYWQLDRTAGTGNAAVTLYWENAAGSGINSCTGAPNTGDLVVARFTGTCWENKNTSGGSYSGSCSGTSAGSVTSDVISSFSPFTFASKSSAVNPLPVELLYFTGENKEKANILEWKTAAEFNNDFFSLERSANGYEFEPLITVDGTGNSSSERSYRYVDEKPLDGKNYYRLKQTDFDGEVKYAANIIVLEWQRPAEFQLIPNPASTEIFIYSLNEKEENVTIEITDISGRAILHKKPFSVGGSGSALSIDISPFSEGIYFVAIHDLAGKPLSLKKFVKMK